MSSNTASFYPNTQPPSSNSPLDPHRYDDIIHLERPISATHPRMSLEARSAQFAPFATLSRYHEIIKSIDDAYERKLDNDRQKSLIETEPQDRPENML